jgi:hypothetical protein
VAVYFYSEQEIERSIRSMKRFRSRFCLIAAAVLAGGIMAALYRTEWLFGKFPHSRSWPLTVLLVGFGLPLFNFFRDWKRAPGRIEKSMKGFKVELSSEEASVTYSVSAPVRRLEREEITRAEEPSWGRGLYLRTANRYRSITIPRKIDGYQAAKDELSRMGIPIVTNLILPNWEEFVGVLLFGGTMICAFTVHGFRFLIANLVVALLLSVGMFFVISSNPDNFPYMRWRRLGAFIPPVFAALGLWLAVQG